MRVLIAPDSFKGSLSAPDVARAIARGVAQICPECEIEELPIADGGEGTLDVLVASAQGRHFNLRTRAPLGNRHNARFGVLGDNKTAVVEMAQASGLTLVPAGKRNPLQASSFGTGELVKAALDLGYRSFIVTLGGSATVDGGTGMLAALGARFLDINGIELTPGGACLGRIASLDLANLDRRLQETKVVIASDVTNPLCGPLGAAPVFGPQKGATPAMVGILSEGLENWARVIASETGKQVADTPGGGAAGGLGAALIAFAGGSIRPGVDVVLDALQFDSRLAGVSLVFTGEGRMDHQTAAGKAPVGVARRAKLHGCRTVALVGAIGPGYDAVYAEGIDGVFPIADRPMSLRESLSHTAALLTDCAARVTHFYLRTSTRSS